MFENLRRNGGLWKRGIKASIENLQRNGGLWKRDIKASIENLWRNGEEDFGRGKYKESEKNILS